MTVVNNNLIIAINIMATIAPRGEHADRGGGEEVPQHLYGD